MIANVVLPIKKKMNQIFYQKLLEIEKEIVREVAWGDKPYLRKSADRNAQMEGVCSIQRTDMCFAICRLSQVRFITPRHLTHNLFCIPEEVRFCI